MSVPLLVSHAETSVRAPHDGAVRIEETDEERGVLTRNNEQVRSAMKMRRRTMGSRRLSVYLPLQKPQPGLRGAYTRKGSVGISKMS
jgi:hypothetical protein